MLFKIWSDGTLTTGTHKLTVKQEAVVLALNFVESVRINVPYGSERYL
jgi:hypothetical protein